MAKPKLTTKPITIARRLEAQGESSRRGGYARAGNHDDPAARNVYSRYLRYWDGRILRVEVTRALVVQGPAVPGTQAPPAFRIKLNADQKLNRVVLKRVRCASTNILSRSKFGNRLDVLVNGKVDADAGD